MCHQPTVTDQVPGSWGSTATTMAELGMLSSSFRPWPFSRTFPATVSEPLEWGTWVHSLVPMAGQEPSPSGLTVVQSPSHRSQPGWQRKPFQNQLIAFLFKLLTEGLMIPMPAASCLSSHEDPAGFKGSPPTHSPPLGSYLLDP